jgi:hypothetical protein
MSGFELVVFHFSTVSPLFQDAQVPVLLMLGFLSLYIGMRFIGLDRLDDLKSRYYFVELSSSSRSSGNSTVFKSSKQK